MMNLSGGSGRRWQLMIIVIPLLLISFSINSCGQLLPTSRQLHRPFNNNLLAYIPKQALIAGILDTAVIKDKVWSRSNLHQSALKSINSWLTLLNLDFNQDIRPLLGQNIAFAITTKDIDRDRSNGRQNGYLLAIDTADVEQLRELLELFWQRQTVAGTQPFLTEVSGVPIIAGSIASEQRRLATAVVGASTLLVANDVKVLRQSLRVAQIPALQLNKQDCCTSLWLNLNIPEFIDWLGLASPNHIRFMPTPQWQQLHAAIEAYSQRLVINTQLNRLNRQPIGLSATTALKSLNTPSPKSMGDSPQRYLPTDLAWVAIGENLIPLWTGISDELAQYEQLPSPLQQWQQWYSTKLTQTLSEPLVQLLSSHYAIGQLSDGNWLMALENRYPTAISQLDSMAKQQGLTISQLSFAEQTATAWSRLKTKLDTRNRETTVETDLILLHTKVGNYNIFSTSLAGLTSALETSSHTLLDTQRFQRTVQPMNTPNQGYMYGTWYEIERLLASTRWFSLLKPILQPWLQSIDAIAITGYEQTVNQLTGTISILLKK